LEWITVPVTKGRAQPALLEVFLADGESSLARHARLIRHHYRKSLYLHEYGDEILGLILSENSRGKLCDLTIPLISIMSKALGIETTVLRSSDISVSGKRSDLSIAICEAISADTYVATPGSTAYLIDDRPAFESAGIEVVIQGYQHPEWKQQFEPFMPQVSAIDLLLNAGPEAQEIMRSGRADEIRLDNL